MIVSDSPIFARFSMLSATLEGFTEIIGIKIIKLTVSVSGVQLAAHPACAPVSPPAGYLHPGSCRCYNWLGRLERLEMLGRLVTPLPDVRDTHQVSPRSWKNHLCKVGMTLQNLLSGCWRLTPKSLRDLQTGISESAPSQTCRKKPFSVRSSARFCS